MAANVRLHEMTRPQTRAQGLAYGAFMTLFMTFGMELYNNAVKMGINLQPGGFSNMTYNLIPEVLREIVGKDPDYFEAHAVMSKNLNQAIHDAAERHGFKEQVASFDPAAIVCCGQTDVHMALEDMLPPEQYDPTAFIRRTVEGMADGETYVLVFHPGYLDAFIPANSSLTVNRTKEVDAPINPELRTWLEAQPDLRLVDYRDL